MKFVNVRGHRLEYEYLTGADRAMPVIVFLHEGLGSVAMWRDFPRRVVEVTGCSALVYSRHGYGGSGPLREPRDVDYMHEEGLKALPELLDKLSVSNPILLGHSDGGSISLICAGGTQRAVAGLILLAPHIIVEEVSVESIRKAKQTYESGELRAKLTRYHANPDSAFWGWNDIWLDPLFLAWNIEEYLPNITCPILAIQGEDDQYGTMEQLERIERLAPNVELLKLADCCHRVYRDRPRAVVSAIEQFVKTVASRS